MPSLKDLTCSIELSDSQKALQEFGTIYKDGIVETFVAVPSRPQSFSVHLTSDKFIAPGLSMQELKLRKPPDSRSLVDFRVRQKEEKQKDGSMVAREWTFEKLSSTSADDAPDLCSPNILDNIGCIEVIVLRCGGPRTAQTASQMNLDGACDLPDHHFGLDGQPRSPARRSAYDDRENLVSAFSNGNGPPPPVSFYRSPYAETVRSHEENPPRTRSINQTARAASPLGSRTLHSRPHSRYSEPISPGTRPSKGIPYLGYQYGSGPLPPEEGPSHRHQINAPTKTVSGVDAGWLDRLLTTAVKKGVEESRRNEGPPEALIGLKQHTLDKETASQPPGAWPTSPFGNVAQPSMQPELVEPAMYSSNANPGVAWGQPVTGWGYDQAVNRRETNVAWIEEPISEKESNADGWNSFEQTPDDPWDTDETWTTKKPNDWGARSRRASSRGLAAPGYSNSRPWSPVTVRTHERRRSSNERSQRTRSKSRTRRSRRKVKSTSSSEDNDGWTHIEATSDSVTSFGSWEGTAQPSHSRSQLHIPRSKDRRSLHSKSARGNHERKSSRHTSQVPTWQQAESPPRAAPSLITKLTPTVMNAPAPPYSVSACSRRVSGHTTIVPSPTWGCAVPEKSRKNSYATSYNPPAPYAATLHDSSQIALGNDFHDSRSTSSSSWGSGIKSGAKDFLGDSAAKQTAWEENGDSGWGKKYTSTEDGNGWEAMNNNRNSALKTADNAKDVQNSGWDTNNNGWNVEDISIEEETRKKKEADDAWNSYKDDWNINREADTPWGNARDTWNNQDNADKNIAVQWNTDTFDPPVESPNKPTKALSTSKRHTTKSLSKYRQFRSTASDLAPKPHWQFPPPPSKKTILSTAEDHDSSKVPFIAPKEPLYKISKETASEKGIEHQVRAGRGMQYGHAVGRPEYLDRLDKPYAVFRFKYRSRSILKVMFGDEIPNHKHLTLPTPNSTTANDAKHKLKDLPKDQLIDKMLELQAQLAHKDHVRKRESAHKGPEGSKHKERRKSDATEVLARDLTESWVKQQSRETSEKGKGEKKKRGGGAVGKREMRMRGGLGDRLLVAGGSDRK
ncbi:Nn.00g056570.m01.CDS01 [Neocucurbitaria sp. VM-36]